MNAGVERGNGNAREAADWQSAVDISPAAPFIDIIR
jgi:hypothetical protein